MRFLPKTRFFRPKTAQNGAKPGFFGRFLPPRTLSVRQNVCTIVFVFLKRARENTQKATAIHNAVAITYYEINLVWENLMNHRRRFASLSVGGLNMLKLNIHFLGNRRTLPFPKYLHLWVTGILDSSRIRPLVRRPWLQSFLNSNASLCRSPKLRMSSTPVSVIRHTT